MGLLDSAQSVILAVAFFAGLEEPLQTANEYISRGMQNFRENKIEDSILDFDHAAKLDPAVAPHLWQRGISYFYTGEFQKGRDQFESHQAVNPHDVENATWHFLCVAKLDGMESAKKAILKINTSRDTRVPMAQIYKFYAGQGSAEAVLLAATKAGTQSAHLYAHLYLALYYEVDGNVDLARKHIGLAAAAKLKNNYMHEVAKIHRLRRNWD